MYQFTCEKRNSLNVFLRKNGIDSKIHYQKPIHLHKASKYLGYKKGDFPVAESMASTSLSLPVHEFIDERHVRHMVNSIDKFYNK